jgi:hypothetical protein
MPGARAHPGRLRAARPTSLQAHPAFPRASPPCPCPTRLRRARRRAPSPWHGRIGGWPRGDRRELAQLTAALARLSWGRPLLCSEQACSGRAGGCRRRQAAAKPAAAGLATHPRERGSQTKKTPSIDLGAGGVWPSSGGRPATWRRTGSLAATVPCYNDDMRPGGRFERISDNLDERLVRLLRVAVKALAAEDRLFRRAFCAARDQDRGFYADENQGLAYWVFETQLVYTIFKSWIPLARVRWEGHTYSDSPRYSADLAVFPDKFEGSAHPCMVFEAKWWNKSFERCLKQRRAIDRDVKKILGTRATICSFLLAFWWDTQGDLRSSVAEVERYCSRACRLPGQTAKLVFQDAFPSRFCDGEPRTPVADGLFAMAALRVDSIAGRTKT